jgi:hypothetical protein
MEPAVDVAASLQMPTQFVSRYEDFAREEVFLNFTIIYKSHKCCSMTFTGEICRLMNLDRETVIFQLIVLFESGTFLISHTVSCPSILPTIILHAGIISFQPTV